MKLPTQEYCMNLFNQYVVPANIKAHCMKVRDVAVFLGEKIRQAGQDIELELVDRLALLHDMFKIVAIKDIAPDPVHTYVFSEQELAMRAELQSRFPDMHETEVAYELLKGEFPEFAHVVREEGGQLPSDEVRKEIALVRYCDYITMKTTVVSLDERFAYLRERYPTKSSELAQSLPDRKQEEQRIFKHIQMTFDDLKRAINEEQT